MIETRSRREAVARQSSGRARPHVWALVPLKNLDRAKSRLAPALGAEGRRSLVLAMAEDVLTALGRVRTIERILLVSNEPEAGSLLQPGGRAVQGSESVEVFYTSNLEGLNRELEQAARYAASRGAKAVLILHADLPWLTSRAVQRFIAQCPRSVACAAQDKLGTGTNAIFAPLPLPIPLVFGVDSLPKFRAGAKRRGIQLCVVDDSVLAQDIDRLEDFERLLDEDVKSAAIGRSTRRFLKLRGDEKPV